MHHEPAKVVAFITAAAQLGMGKTAAYAALREGTFPLRVLKIGCRYRVSRSELEAFLAGDRVDTPSV
jgi:excisionase family DNA binding protein